MAIVSMRLSEEAVSRLDAIAKLTGRSKTYYMQEAVYRHLEDIEDVYLAEKRYREHIENGGQSFTIEEVERHLGLDS